MCSSSTPGINLFFLFSFFFYPRDWRRSKICTERWSGPNTRFICFICSSRKNTDLLSMKWKIKSCYWHSCFDPTEILSEDECGQWPIRSSQNQWCTDSSTLHKYNFWGTCTFLEYFHYIPKQTIVLCFLLRIRLLWLLCRHILYSASTVICHCSDLTWIFWTMVTFFLILKQRLLLFVQDSDTKKSKQVDFYQKEVEIIQTVMVK